MRELRTVRPRIGRPLAIDELTVGDLEVIRLLLRGDSVVDWHQLQLSDHAEVDRFLRVNEFDPDSPREMERLEELRTDAVDYLNRTFSFPVPDEVAYIMPARDLLLVASRKGKHRRWACVLLKVMHIINHLIGREAMVRLPIADDQVFRVTELKVIQVVEELRAAGLPITDFEWSRKPRDSLITKLLAKRSTLAAKVYDKLRFRLTVRDYEDLLPTLTMLTHQLIPFNYIVPGESVNSLVSFEDAITSSAALAPLGSGLQRETEEQEEDADGTPLSLNEFSGANYRIVNFVADLPLRLEALVPPEEIPSGCGHVTFVLTEFQLADKLTATNNEKGEASHERYKARQLKTVRKRLMRKQLPR